MAVASAENFTWLGLAADGTSSQPRARHSAAMGAYPADSAFYVFGGKGNKMNGTEVLGEVRYLHPPSMFCQEPYIHIYMTICFSALALCSLIYADQRVLIDPLPSGITSDLCKYYMQVYYFSHVMNILFCVYNPRKY